jgi:hypothetical protein
MRSLPWAAESVSTIWGRDPLISRYWKDRIGARVNPAQATILNLALDPSGVSPAEAASATGLELSAAEEALAYLKLQVLGRAEREALSRPTRPAGAGGGGQSGRGEHGRIACPSAAAMVGRYGQRWHRSAGSRRH